jgi:hypothetical protein
VTFPYTSSDDVTTLGGSCGALSGDSPNVNVTISGTASQTGTAPCTAGSWSYTTSPTLTADGPYTVSATQSDAAGNNGTSGSKSLTINHDSVAPTVVSINRVDSSPTDASSVSWTVTFSEPVTGVDSGDFALASTGLSGASISSSVSGSGATRTVSASTGSGDGTLGLNLVDNDSISDIAGNKLGGTGTTGAANGSFTGQVYTIDHTAPGITISNPGVGATYIKSVTPAPLLGFSCVDAGAGLKPAPLGCAATLQIGAGTPAAILNGAAIDVATVGPHSVVVNAVDLLNHPSSLTRNYTVRYDTDGKFKQPIENVPSTTINQAKAGQAIPVKFSLHGYQGMDILDTTTSQATMAPAGSNFDPVPTDTAGNSPTLSYDAGSDTYMFVWKTSKDWAGMTRQLVVKLNDGVSQFNANFRFTK